MLMVEAAEEVEVEGVRGSVCAAERRMNNHRSDFKEHRQEQDRGGFLFYTQLHHLPEYHFITMFRVSTSLCSALLLETSRQFPGASGDRTRQITHFSEP